jgi:hypothetical protein
MDEAITRKGDVPGREVLTAYAPVPPLDWIVFLELPAAEADGLATSEVIE